VNWGKKSGNVSEFDIFGTKISTIQYKELLIFLSSPINKSGYICLTDSIVLSRSFKDEELRDTLNQALYNLPDGKFIEIYAKLNKIDAIKTISGYLLLLDLLKTSRTHYFYGSDKSKLIKIKKYLESNFPQAKVIGYKSAPMFSIKEINNNANLLGDISEIKTKNPDIIWVALGGIKQDFYMKKYCAYLDKSIMIGVGAVFDYISGDVKRSPEWIKRIYLRWLYRLIFSPDKKRIKTVLETIKILMLTFWKNAKNNCNNAK